MSRRAEGVAAPAAALPVPPSYSAALPVGDHKNLGHPYQAATAGDHKRPPMSARRAGRLTRTALAALLVGFTVAGIEAVPGPIGLAAGVAGLAVVLFVDRFISRRGVEGD